MTTTVDLVPRAVRRAALCLWISAALALLVTIAHALGFVVIAGSSVAATVVIGLLTVGLLMLVAFNIVRKRGWALALCRCLRCRGTSGNPVSSRRTCDVPLSANNPSSKYHCAIRSTNCGTRSCVHRRITSVVYVAECQRSALTFRSRADALRVRLNSDVRPHGSSQVVSVMQKRNLLCLPALVGLAACAAPDGFGTAPSIVGAWIANVTLLNCATGQPSAAPSFRAMVAFHAGGTLSEASGPSVRRTPSFGSWASDARGEYNAVSTLLTYDADGALSGTQEIRRTIRLSADGKQFVADTRTVATDASGNVTFRGCARGEARRVE